STPMIRLTPAQQQRREPLRKRFGQVQGLYQQGKSLGEIARIVQIDTNTLRYGCRKASLGRERALLGDENPERAAWHPICPISPNGGRRGAKIVCSSGGSCMPRAIRDRFQVSSRMWHSYAKYRKTHSQRLSPAQRSLGQWERFRFIVSSGWRSLVQRPAPKSK